MYTVKNVKSFVGREGYGFNADLCRDGRKVAFVVDDAGGGECRFQWADIGEPKVEVMDRISAGRSAMVRMTPEEARLQEHVSGLPKDKLEIMPGVEKEFPVTMDSFVARLVDAYEEERRLRRMCRRKTVYRMKNEGYYLALNTPYTPQVGAHIRKTAGSSLDEIVNERFLAPAEVPA